MKRRNFIKTTATGSAFLVTNNTFLRINNIYDELQHQVIDPVVPMKFYPDLMDSQLSEIIEIKTRFRLRRFAFRFPDKGIRVSRIPVTQDFENFGNLLLQIKKSLAPYGIEVYWWCNATLKSGKNSPWQSQIGIDGRKSKIDATCPLDTDFQEGFTENFATIVKIASPGLITIEDDLNLGHAGLGCFCPLHLEEFAKRQGRYLSREELFDIFNQETPERMKLRKDWATLSRDTLVEFASLIREKVDKIAPETRILLHQSGGADRDGDNTEALTKAFAGKTRPLVRLYGATYGSDSAINIPTVSFHCLYSAQRLPADFELYHESDTFPNNRFYTSATKLKSFMTLAFSYGLDDSIFWPVTMLDNPALDKGYLTMFKEEISRFNSIKTAVKDCRVEGCEIVYNPVERLLKNPTEGYSWTNVTGRYGIPHTSVNGKVKLISDNTVQTLSDEEIKKYLGGNIFLDGRAAFQLSERGYGEMIGAEVQPGNEINFIYEALRENAGYKNVNGKYMTNYLHYGRVGPEGGSFYQLNPIKGSEIITDFLDPDEKPVTPGIIRFTNKLGGRIAITAFDFAVNNENSAILNFRKKEIIRQTIEWLGNEPLPVFVRQAPNVFCIFCRSKSNNYAVIVIINLCSDQIQSVFLDVSPEWINSRFELLNKNGNWNKVKIEKQNLTVKLQTIAALMDPVVIKLNKD